MTKRGFVEKIVMLAYSVFVQFISDGPEALKVLFRNHTAVYLPLNHLHIVPPVIGEIDVLTFPAIACPFATLCIFSFRYCCVGNFRDSCEVFLAQ